MTPTDYLSIARRHWKLIAALVVVAVAVVYWTSPEKAKGTYEATHIVEVSVDEGRGGGSDTTPEKVALYTTVDQVAARAAATLGYDGDPAALANKVQAEADRTVGVVRITATDDDPDRAAEIANTFAAEVEGYLTEQDRAERDEDLQAIQTREDEIRAEIAALDGQILADPANTLLVSERDELIRSLGEQEERRNALATDPVSYATVQTATSGSERDPLPGTRSREQRMLLAGVVALVLGFGLAIALDRSDTRIRHRRTAEAHFGSPVLAEVPQFNLPARRRKLVVADEPDSVRAEAFRTLRTAIMLVRQPDHAERGNGHQEGSHLPRRPSLTPKWRATLERHRSQLSTSTELPLSA